MENMIIPKLAFSAGLICASFFLSAQGIEIQSGASIEFIGSPSLEISNGDFINNGTFSNGTGMLTLSGSMPGVISGSSPATMYDVTLNNSAGISIAGDMTVNHSLTLTNGLLNTGVNKVIINDNATVSGGSNTSYINGNCRKVGNEAFTFPVGNDGEYAPIGISAPTNITDAFSASYTYGSPNSTYNITSLDAGLDHVSDCEYWILERPTGTSNVAVTLSWDTRSCGVTNLSELAVAHWDGAKWVSEGNTTTTGNTSNGTITSNVVSSFSPFTLGSTTSENPLPVELMDFSAFVRKDKVLLIWHTATEVNNDYFAVEKYIDATNWKTIGQRNGSPWSDKVSSYEFLDENPVTGIQYYRLRQVALDGSYLFSDTKAVEFKPDSGHEIAVYPSPARDWIEILFGNAMKSNATLRLLDISGQTVMEAAILNAPSSIRLDISQLRNGVYILELRQNDDLSRVKVVKN